MYENHCIWSAKLVLFVTPPVGYSSDTYNYGRSVQALMIDVLCLMFDMRMDKEREKKEKERKRRMKKEG